MKNRFESVLKPLLLSALALATQTALANVDVTALSRSGNGQTTIDADAVAAGSASAAVSGAHTDGAFSHTFIATVSANDVTGAIRAATTDTTVGASFDSGSFADALISGTIFIAPGTGTGTVELSMSVLGSFRNTGGPSGLSFQSFVTLGGGGTVGVSGSWEDVFGRSVSYGRSIVTPEEGEVITPGLINSPANVSATVRARETITLSPFGTTSLLVTAHFRVNSSNAPDSVSNAQFDQTAFVTLTLPEGWTYTSQSGTFLTQTSPIPEPSIVALFALGCGALCPLMRRRRGR